MTFLTPISAIIAAMVTVPALLVLYFLKLRRRPVRVGSTMLWRRAAEDLQANVPLQWLKPSALLILQLLILTAFLLALARPAINTTGGMPNRVFLVIDRSASMQATDMPEGTSRFTEAVRLARKILGRINAGGSHSEITLLAASSKVEIIAGPTRSTGELLRALDALVATDQPGNLPSALRLVQALAMPDDPEAENAPKPLVLILSDGSTSSPLPALSAEVRFERAAPEVPGENFGVVALAATRDHETPSRVRLFARLLSTRAEPTTLGVSIRLDGKVVERRSVEVQPADDSGPGQTPLALQLTIPDSGLLTMTIDRQDTLAADDSASLILAAPSRPSVLLVREEETEASGTGWLLTDVLRELDLSALTLMSVQRVQTMGSRAYVGVDLAIFDSVVAPGTPPVPSIHFGRTPALPGLVASDGPKRVLPILAWERTHPLLRDLSLDAVRVGKCRVLAPADDRADLTELARTAGGVVLAEIKQNRTSHIVVGFDLVQSTWPVDYSFPIFLANAVESLPHNSPLSAGWSATTASPVFPPFPLENNAVLVDPEGKERPILRSDSDMPDSVHLGLLDRAGIWHLDDVLIPVNLFDAHESAIAAPSALPVAGGGLPAAGTSAGNGEPREVWSWFALLGTGLLVMEWVVFGLRARV